MAELPQNIILIAKMIQAKGGRAMLVGGCVRDELMGREVQDWDLEVYGIEPSRLKEILNRFASEQGLEVNAVGEAFTVYKIGSDLDIALPRRDRKIARGH